MSTIDDFSGEYKNIIFFMARQYADDGLEKPLDALRGQLRRLKDNGHDVFDVKLGAAIKENPALYQQFERCLKSVLPVRTQIQRGYDGTSENVRKEGNEDVRLDKLRHLKLIFSSDTAKHYFINTLQKRMNKPDIERGFQDYLYGAAIDTLSMKDDFSSGLQAPGDNVDLRQDEHSAPGDMVERPQAFPNANRGPELPEGLNNRKHNIVNQISFIHGENEEALLCFALGDWGQTKFFDMLESLSRDINRWSNLSTNEEELCEVKYQIEEYNSALTADKNAITETIERNELLEATLEGLEKLASDIDILTKQLSGFSLAIQSSQNRGNDKLPPR